MNTLIRAVAVVALAATAGCDGRFGASQSAEISATPASTERPPGMPAWTREACPRTPADPAAYTDAVLRYLETDPA